MLSVYDIFERLSIVHPFERPKAVGNRHNTERFNMQVPVHAGRVVPENSIHNLEKLLYTLIQT